MMKKARGQAHYKYLLIGMVILLLSGPLLLELVPTIAPVVNELAFSVTLLIGVWSLAESRRGFVLGVSLALTSALTTMLSLIVHENWTFISLGLQLIFCLLATGIVIRDLFLKGKVDANKILGAICLYLLLGVVWSILYTALNSVSSGSFSGLQYSSLRGQLTEFIYFSFITLTTLGYGDISPISPLARTLAYLEAGFGQFYIAILVASLVGIHITGRR